MKVLLHEQMPDTGAELIDVDYLRVPGSSRTSSVRCPSPVVQGLWHRQAPPHRIHPGPGSAVFPTARRVLHVYVLRVFVQPPGHCPAGGGHPESSGDTGWPPGVWTPLFPLRRTAQGDEDCDTKVRNAAVRPAPIPQLSPGKPPPHQDLEMRMRLRVGNTCLAALQHYRREHHEARKYTEPTSRRRPSAKVRPTGPTKKQASQGNGFFSAAPLAGPSRPRQPSRRIPRPQRDRVAVGHFPVRR